LVEDTLCSALSSRGPSLFESFCATFYILKKRKFMLITKSLITMTRKNRKVLNIQ
jgi:hypothetical protein